MSYREGPGRTMQARARLQDAETRLGRALVATEELNARVERAESKRHTIRLELGAAAANIRHFVAIENGGRSSLTEWSEDELSAIRQLDAERAKKAGLAAGPPIFDIDSGRLLKKVVAESKDAAERARADAEDRLDRAEAELVEIIGQATSANREAGAARAELDEAKSEVEKLSEHSKDSGR